MRGQITGRRESLGVACIPGPVVREKTQPAGGRHLMDNNPPATTTEAIHPLGRSFTSLHPPQCVRCPLGLSVHGAGAGRWTKVYFCRHQRYQC